MNTDQPAALGLTPLLCRSCNNEMRTAEMVGTAGKASRRAVRTEVSGSTSTIDSLVALAESQPWLGSDPKGNYWPVELGKYGSVKDLLTICCGRFADLPSFASMGQAKSF